MLRNIAIQLFTIRISKSGSKECTLLRIILRRWRTVIRMVSLVRVDWLQNPFLMIPTLWNLMVKIFQSAQVELVGQMIRGKSIRKPPTQRILNGLILKMNISLFGWEQLVCQHLGNCGVELKMTLNRELTHLNLRITIILRLLQGLKI